jgi:ankyrin repeat protein
MSFVSGISHDASSICNNGGCPCKNNPSLSVSIWTAAQIGDFLTVKQRIEKNSSVVSKLDEYGYSPLHYAAQNGHTSIVKYLLSKGALVDFEKCGATALHRAVYAGHFESVKLLVMAGANLNAVDQSFGDLNTPAHKSLLINRLDILNYLIECGADTTQVRNAAGQTVNNLLQNLDHKHKEKEDIEINSSEKSNNYITTSQYCMPVNQLTRYSLYKSTSKSVSAGAVEQPVLCSKCNQSSVTFSRLSNGSLICSACKRSLYR